MKLLLPACLSAALAFGGLFAKADVVTEWNSLILDAIRNESTSPPLAARDLAILHAAIYDAVNAIERTHEPYLVSMPSPPGASVEGAVVGAAYECLTDLYPSQTAAFDAALDRFLDRTAATTNRADGLLLGQFTALEILTWRSADGSSTSVPYIPGTEPGDWRRTPPFFRPPELPQWAYVDPFVMTNGAQFRPAGPPSLTSPEYTRDLNQVKQLGALNSTIRTAEQTLLARFWSDFSYTVTPAGHWNQIAQNIATNRAGTLAQNARLFALLNMAMADAAIFVWDAKYLYNFWRPVTAIQQAQTDGNPDTEADPNWAPLLNTPPFPEYVSGHSAFSAAAATVLADYYGTDRISFTVGSDTLPGVFRSYDSLTATAEEIALSRIYGGIHFLSADLDGLKGGHDIGQYVMQNVLRLFPGEAVLTVERTPEAGVLLVQLSGTAGHAYVLESSTNLIQWTPILTNTIPFVFSDAAADGRATRFFRAIAIQ